MSNEKKGNTGKNTEKKVEKKVIEKKCIVCKGAGIRICDSCEGKGSFPVSMGREVECEKCNGTGKFSCSNCKGTGVIKE